MNRRIPRRQRDRRLRTLIPPLSMALGTTLGVALTLTLGVALAVTSCERPDEAEKSFQRAREHWKHGAYREAAYQFAALAELYPEHPVSQDALFWAASLFDHFLHDPQQAAHAYRQLLRRSQPGGSLHLEASKQMAEHYRDDKDKFRQALKIYANLLQYDYPVAVRANVRLRLGRLYLQSRDLNAAREQFLALLTEAPASLEAPHAAYLAAYSYTLEERFPFALALLERLPAEYPKNSVAQRATRLRAEILEEQGQLRQALALWRQLQAANPRSDIVAKRLRGLEKRIADRPQRRRSKGR